MATRLIKSDRTIQTLKPGTKRLSDGEGLYLLPFAKGAKHYWRYNYTHEGKRNTLSIGVYPETGLALAREKADEARARVARGENPSVVRKKFKQAINNKVEAEKRAKRGEPPLGSFEEVACRWIGNKRHVWTAGYCHVVLRRLQMHIFPIVGYRQLEDISPKMMLDTCRKVEACGHLDTANRLREIGSQVFRFAIAEGRDLRDPCADISDALKKPIVRHRSAITNPEQLGQLLRAIDEYSGSFLVRSALQLLPHLMLRSSELRMAEWREIDLDNKLWYIPAERMKGIKASKMNKPPHLVPLSTQVVSIFEELFALTGRSGLVFPSQGRLGRCMSENTLNMALRAMGYDSSIVTSHGFRATARTLLVEVLGTGESIAEMQLAHSVKDALGTAYNRTQFIPQRLEMMQSWSDYLEDLKHDCAKTVHPTLPKFTPVTDRFKTNGVQREGIAR
jgi:integrase